MKFPISTCADNAELIAVKIQAAASVACSEFTGASLKRTAERFLREHLLVRPTGVTISEFVAGLSNRLKHIVLREFDAEEDCRELFESFPFRFSAAKDFGQAAQSEIGSHIETFAGKMMK